MFFSRDPQRSLDKARRLLAGGDPHAAFETARKGQERARPPLSGRLAEVAEQARQAVVHGALSRAQASTGEGLLEDATEWLRGALGYAEGAEREEILARLSEVEAAGRRVAFDELAAPAEPAADAEPEQMAGSVDPDQLYDVYVGTLRPDLRELYTDRPDAFRRSILAISEGRFNSEEAEGLVAAASEEPDDPVLRLERGRLHYARGALESALPDLAAAAEGLGDEPIDGATWYLSPAAIWCEVALELGRHAEVLERLEGLGEVTLRDPYLSYLYAQSLLGAGEEAEAERFLLETVQEFPNVVYLARELAWVQVSRGNARAAIATLETSLNRSCAGGGCASPELEPETVRQLVSLYLDEGGPADRIEDLLQMLRGTQGGSLPPEDWELVARHHELVGDGDLADKARANAQRLAAERDALMPPAPPDAAPA